MAGGEYVSVSTQKDTEEAAVAKRAVLLDKTSDLQNISMLLTYKMVCETS